MKATKKPVRQHWVSQFYLRYFSTPETRNDKNPHVWIFSKNSEDGNPCEVGIKDICAQRYLCSPKDESGTRQWDVDDKIGGIETLLGVIWPSLANDFVDLGLESIRKAVSLFIAIMILRHPDNINAVTEIHSKLFDFYEQFPKNQDGNPNLDELDIQHEFYMADTSNWDEYNNCSADEHHRFFVDFIQSDARRLAEILKNKRWSIVVSEEPVFITSDNPVCKMHQSKSIFGFRTINPVDI
ncbi:MAG: DUF4238 domain-containing protein [Nitrospirae bacterium]|nr:DUF4238 domain-containing protein [Nitrospirota bacterium]